MIHKVEKLMVGSALSHPGGMTTVVRLYEQSGFLENIRYMPSYRSGKLWLRLFTFLLFLFSLVYTLRHNHHLRLIHMHVSQRGSFIRKSIAARLCRLFHKKVVWHMHGSEFTMFYQNAPAFIQQYIRKTLQDLDCIIALSESRRRELLTIAPEARVTVLYNPCVLRPPISRPIPKDSPVRFLFLGHFLHRKGLYDMIEAMRLLSGSRAHLSLYGGLVERDKVTSLLKRYNLTAQTHVDGWISGEQKHQIMLDAHVLLLPSYNEGLPMAILEAMSYSLPVIATPVGGVAEAVRDGETGFLIPPGNVAALANRMQHFIDHPEAIQTMGEAGYCLAAEKFELSNIVAELETLYQKILEPDSIKGANRSSLLPQPGPSLDPDRKISDQNASR